MNEMDAMKYAQILVVLPLLVPLLNACASSGDAGESGESAFTGSHGPAVPPPEPPASGACEKTLHGGSVDVETLATFANCVAARNDAYVKALGDDQQKRGVFEAADIPNLDAGVAAFRSGTKDICQVAADVVFTSSDKATASDSALALASCSAMREVNLGRIFGAYPAMGSHRTAIAKDTADFPDCYPIPPASDPLHAANDYQSCTLVHFAKDMDTVAGSIASATGDDSGDAARQIVEKVSASMSTGNRGYSKICPVLAVAVAGAHGDVAVPKAVQCQGDGTVLAFREANGQDKP
jgi:hypothetical protein